MLTLTDSNISSIKSTVPVSIVKPIFKIKEEEEKNKIKPKPIWENRKYTSFTYNNPTKNWNPEVFDWQRYSSDLVVMLGRKNEIFFRRYWNPDKFNWKDHSAELASHCPYHFNIWWDKDKFNWDTSSNLAKNISIKYFHKWWNPDRFDWKNGSESLADYCSKYFNDWWDTTKFNWSKSMAVRNLLWGGGWRNKNMKIDEWWSDNKFDWDHHQEHLYDQIDSIRTWWNPDKFNWTGGIEKFLKKLSEYMRSTLISHEEKEELFKVWWDSDKFDWENKSYLLAEHFNSMFDIWWDPYKFNLEFQSYSLPRYCSDNFTTWWKYKDSLKCKDKDYKFFLDHCHVHLELWWDRDNFPTKEIPSLIKECNSNFHIWWKPKQFRYSTSTIKMLIQYCSKDFRTWYNSAMLSAPISGGFGAKEVRKALNSMNKNTGPAKYVRKTYQLMDILYKEHKDLWKEDCVIYQLTE